MQVRLYSNARVADIELPIGERWTGPQVESYCYEPCVPVSYIYYSQRGWSVLYYIRGMKQALIKFTKLV